MNWGSWSTIALPDDPDRIRPFPPPATPLQFPSYEPPRAAQPYEESNARQHYKLYAAIQRPSDIRQAHFDALNVRCRDDTPLEELIPGAAEDGASYLPPKHWDDPACDPAAQDGDPARTLCTGDPAPARNVYLQRKSELDLDQDDAFRAVERLPPKPGRKKAITGNYYKFWVGLNMMSHHWDTSLDEVVDVVDVADGAPAAPPKAPQKSAEDVQADINAMDVDTPEPDAEKEPAKGYKGRRMGTGSDMPASFREETVRSFVETIAWLFRCQVQPPRVPPRLSLQESLFPVRISASVYRAPKDRALAQRGHLEGPVLGIYCRNETCFYPSASTSSSTSLASPTLPTSPDAISPSALDTFHELLCALLLAQERSRQGRTERLPGEGKWYTTVPRWGGAPGGEVGNPAGNTDEPAPGTPAAATAATAATAPSTTASSTSPSTTAGARTRAPATPSPNATAPSQSQRAADRAATRALLHESRLRAPRTVANGPRLPTKSRKESLVESWTRLSPGSGIWDPRCGYARIGAPATTTAHNAATGGRGKVSAFDEVWLVSSLNHHVALVRLRVSNSYLRWVEGGVGVRVPVPPSGRRREVAEGAGELEMADDTPENARTGFGAGTKQSAREVDTEDKQDWYVLDVKRSRWFDLLDRADRLEAMRGVWGVLAYLMRDTRPVDLDGEELEEGGGVNE